MVPEFARHRSIDRNRGNGARRHPIVVGICFLLTGVLITAGCTGSDADPSEEPMTLTVLDYYIDEPANTLVGDMLRRCAERADVRIERESVPGPQLMPKVLQRAASDALPDILMLNNPDVAQVAATGSLRPLEEVGLDSSGYVEAVRNSVVYRGKTYGMGPTSNTLGLFYNKRMLDAADVRPPRTWPELRRTAAALTTRDRYGIAFAAPSDYEASWQFFPFLWSNGADETRLDSPDAAQALQLWVDLVESGSASRSVVNWRQADVKDQFVAGNVAMMVNGSWQIPALDEAGLDWGVVPIPTPEAGAPSVSPLGGEVWTIPDHGPDERAKAAGRVLSCVVSPGNAMDRAEQAFQVPSQVSVAKKYAEQNPEMRVFASQVIDARSVTARLGPRYPRATEALYQAIQAALTGKADAAETLRRAQQEVDSR